MAKITDKTKYTVNLVPRESLTLCTTPSPGVVTAPPYNPETDEPAFQRAWQTVNEKIAAGEVKPAPALPAGGIRLRGRRFKQIA